MKCGRRGPVWWGGRQSVLRLLLLSALLILSSADSHTQRRHFLCSDISPPFLLSPQDAFFFNTQAETVRITAKVSGCGNETFQVNVSDLTAISKPMYFSMVQTSHRWYQVEYMSCDKYMIRIGTRIVPLKSISPSPKCTRKPLRLTFHNKEVTFSRPCFHVPRLEVGESPECKTLTVNENDQLSNHSSKSEKTHVRPLFFNEHLNSSESAREAARRSDLLALLYNTSHVTTPPFFKHDKSYINSNNYSSYGAKPEENAIPIFIGILAFTISMCIRFCLCRGKSGVVRRVTTVTVIRSRAATVPTPDEPQDRLDPPPAYVDVVNEVTSSPPDSPGDETSAEPPPPAYADIAGDGLPPTYSEVEANSAAARETTLPPIGEEATEQTFQPPPTAESASASDTSASTPPKGIISKSRYQQRQYSFKVLEEDE